MKYVSRVSTVYQAKNKLDKEIIKLLEVADRILIDKEELPAFKNKIINQIKDLNKQNPRCTPKEPSWYNAGDKYRDFGLSGIECVMFYIHQITKIN
ncbi:hypothetical protein [Elizabethkingia anophelis]|uniref:hypothetical protein n=1 Tax=Elizabethkingia anophelis TaxID=1117645 RepID=UPI00320966C9